MDNYIESIIEIVKGLPGTLSFVAIMIIFLSYKFSESIKKLIGNIRLPNIFRRKRIKSLLYHDFFNVCDEISIKVGSMDLREDINDTEYPVKTKLMRTLIKRKMEVVKEEVKSFIEKPDLHKMESDKIKFEFKRKLNDLVIKYNNECYSIFTDMGISHEDSWFFINKYEEYRSVCIEGFVDRLDSIASNSNYSSNYDKLSSILELCSLAMSIIPRDIKSVYGIINGRFLKYEKEV